MSSWLRRVAPWKKVLIAAVSAPLVLLALLFGAAGWMKWWLRVQPWCRVCGWRWRWGWIEYNYCCDKHWDDGSVWEQR